MGSCPQCTQAPRMVSAWETPTAPEQFPEEKESQGLRSATNGEISPFGSHISLAVTERDTIVVFSTAKGYA